jgi:hypothetical protein
VEIEKHWTEIDNGRRQLFSQEFLCLQNYFSKLKAKLKTFKNK